MLTKIFHPNMSKAGEICVDTLKKGWKKEYGVGHVLVVRCLIACMFDCLACLENYLKRKRRDVRCAVLTRGDDQVLVDLPESRERTG
jgi:hypothetical protein